MAESPSQHGSSVVRLTVESGGRAIDDTIQVVSVSVHKEVNRIPVARLVVEDGDMPEQDFPVSSSGTFVPGAEIRISAGWDDKEEVVFEGIVVKHGISVRESNVSQLVVECRDKAVAMTLARRNAHHVKKKDSEILSGLVGGYGLSADVEATSYQHPELVQFDCTDWDYLVSRAEVNGMLVVADGGKVSVKSPDPSASPALEVTYGQDIIRLEAEMDARWQRSSVAGDSWDPATQALVEGASSSAPAVSQGNLTSSKLAGTFGGDAADELLQTPARYPADVLKAWAEARAGRSELARIRGRVTFEGSAEAAVAGTIQVTGVGDRFAGKGFIGSVLHEIAAGSWTTEVELGVDPFWFSERKDIVAPPAAGVAPAVSGLHLGTVKKLGENPDGEPTIQVAVNAKDLVDGEGVWARLSSFHASKEFGAFFLPEIGDEVILGFLNEDPSFPVVLGSLHSSDRAAPYELADENNTKAIVTREKLKLEFDEEKKVVTIVTPAGNTVVLDDDQKSILLEDETGNKVKLSPDGILLDSPKDITVKATGAISLTATDTISLEATSDLTAKGMNVTAEAQVGLTAKGNASAELSAAGNTTVKGAMVMIN